MSGLILNLGNQQGQKKDEGNLINLVGLNVDREKRKVQPVPVAAHITAKGSEQQQDKQDAAHKEPLPVFLHEQLKVHKGTKDIDHHPQ